MTVVAAEPKPAGPRPPSRLRKRWVRAGLVLVAVGLTVLGLVIAAASGLFHPDRGRGLPTFPSLTEQPDRSLHGTVAYFATDSRCVRIVAASGGSARDVLCLAPEDLAVQPEQGVKPAGPQLAWLPGGRLEVTMFLWQPKPGTPVYEPGWQKIVDVRTGRISAVPAAQVPSTPRTSAGPAVNANGERVSYTFDASSGRVRVSLAGRDGGDRTLLAAQGPGEYTYRFGPVFWAPDGQWIAASDAGRILVITPGPPARTRVLVSGVDGAAGGGPAGPTFAVTATDLG